MKVALWIGFIVIFVWIFSVIISIINPGVVFGPINVVTAILLAIIILAVVEIIWN